VSALASVGALRVFSAPPAGAGVRFRLTATDAGTEIAVTAGEARVAAAGGEVALAAGRAVDLAGDAVGAPVELIPFPRSVAPAVDARFAFGARLALPLSWERVEGATGYRVQVARDLSFREVVLARDTTGTASAFAPASPGTYAWRVAARAADGRLGEFGFARRVFLDEKPPRDHLVSPAEGAVFRPDPVLRFEWAPREGATRYRLVLAAAADLGEREVRADVVSGTSVEVRALEPGTYYWGVYVDDEAREPLFVRPRRLVVQRAPRVRVPDAVKDWGR
jgi:hypothetical protein